MTENGKARELIATSETTVKVDPQNGWYLKRFAALQFEGSVDNFSTNMPIHVLEQQLPKDDTMKLDDGVSKDHWLDAYCIACSVLPNDTCDKTINSRVPYELKQFRRHDRRALNNENMSRVYTFNGKMVATNRHKATEQTTDSLEEFRQRQPNDVCNLKVKEHHLTYRNMNRNYPGSVFLVGNQVHVMQGIAGSKDGEATTYKDTNANSIAAGKCKFVAKNSGILFV